MEIKDREGLRRELQNVFSSSDLRELCFDLDVDCEIFSSKKNELIIELISYLENRDQIPYLIEKLELERPLIDWFSFIARSNGVDKDKLEREDWFERLGFVRDRYPFDSSARLAEKDEILKNFQETFVPHPNLPPDKLLGTENRVGFVYFFAPPGGGKTSLLQYMQDLIAEDGTPSIVVDYFDNFKPKGDYNLFFAKQIIELINKQVDNLIIPASKDPTELLNTVVKQCSDKGIHRIYILIDRVDSDPGIDFTSIMPLVANRNLLDIENLRFKIFLPSKHQEKLSTQIEIYDHFDLEWSRALLKQVLNQRLAACLKEDLRSSITSLGLLCDQDLASDIENKLFECITIETPRQMWFFLEKLVDRHFSGENSARHSTERITSESFKRVCEELKPEEEPVKKDKRNGDNIAITVESNAQAIINVGSKLSDVMQQIDSLPADDAFKRELREAVTDLQNHLKELPAENEDDVEIISDSVQTLVDESNKKRPNKKKVQITIKGLKEAAQNIAKISPIILEIAMRIVDIISRNPK